MFSKDKKIVTYGCVREDDLMADKNTEDEKWEWVEAYKATDADMRCMDYQFEMGTEHVHDGEVKICRSGFHCCENMVDVFRYYYARNGNRFFKVRAYVNVNSLGSDNKIVAKKIQFIEEVSYDDFSKEISSVFPLIETSAEWELVRDIGYDSFAIKKSVEKLGEFGISQALAIILMEPLTTYGINNNLQYIEALSKEGLSKDMFIYLVLKRHEDSLKGNR